MLKKYYDFDDIKSKGIRDVGSLFNQSIDEDCYKPLRDISVFGNKNYYIEYESKGDKDKILSVKKYPDMITLYLRDMINDYKSEREWKILLAMSINFMSSKDFEETRTMQTKSHNIEIMMVNETNEIIKELSEESMRRIEFVFNIVGLLHITFHKISLKRGKRRS